MATIDENYDGQTKLSAWWSKIKSNFSNINTQLISHVANVSNPHSVTKSQVGLGSCDNTSDVNKPVSTAQQTAINSAATAAVNTHKTAAILDHPDSSVTDAKIGSRTMSNPLSISQPITNTLAYLLNTLSSGIYYVLDKYNNHVLGHIDQHPARDITYSGNVTTATDVESAINTLSTKTTTSNGSFTVPASAWAAAGGGPGGYIANVALSAAITPAGANSHFIFKVDYSASSQAANYFNAWGRVNGINAQISGSTVTGFYFYSTTALPIDIPVKYKEVI